MSSPNEIKSYGYPKVNLFLGSDHGAGSSKFLFRANLISPYEMFHLDNIDSQSLIFQFANITCKKDSADVISILNKEINKYIHDFCLGKLVAIKNELNEKTKVVFLPTYVSDVKTTYIRGNLCLNWEVMNEFNVRQAMLHNIEDISNGIVEDNTYLIWDVVAGFNLYITGDLAFYDATISGRENYSSCGCPYCFQSRYTWSKNRNTATEESEDVSIFKIKQIYRKK